MKKVAILSILLIALMLCFAACETLTCEVTFLDMDGNVIAKINVQSGYNATPPEPPVVEGYTFTGWSVDVENIVTDVFVQARYTINTYSVKFLDKDGTLLNEQTVEHGNAATAPQAPEVEGYTFVGWSAEFSEVKADLEIRPLYNVITYRVSFLDYDGNAIKVVEVEHGATVAAEDIPTAEQVNAADARVGYNFTGWDNEVPAVVTADISINALYEEVTVYTVFFHTYMGAVVREVMVEEGELVAQPTEEETPVRDYWRFTGWVINNNPANVYDFSSPVTADMHLFACYEMIYCTVTFQDYDETVVRSTFFPAGISIPEGFVPNAEYMDMVHPHKGRKFVGWDKDPADYAVLTEDVTFTAQYKDCVFVSFTDYEDKELSWVNLGADGILPQSAIPTAEQVDAADTRIGYRFVGWDTDLTVAFTQNTVVKALYEEVKVYTVFFHTYMGAVVKEVMVEEGELVAQPTEEEVPTRDYWRFIGWVINNNPSNIYDFSSPVTGELHLFACYEMIYCKVEFQDYDGTVIRSGSFPAGLSIPETYIPDAAYMNENHPRDGYRFIGWDKDPADYAILTGDVTFIAQYEEL